MRRDERPKAPAQDVMGGVTREGSGKTGRPTPRLVITVELEEMPTASLVAQTHEDELRLRRLLDGPAVRRRLHEFVDDLLDDLAA